MPREKSPKLFSISRTASFAQRENRKDLGCTAEGRAFAPPRAADWWQFLKIETLVLREIHVRLKSSFETSFGKIWERRILLVEVCSEALSGWGEVTAGESPFYHPETNDTSWAVFNRFFASLAIWRKSERAGHSPAPLHANSVHE